MVNITKSLSLGHNNRLHMPAATYTEMNSNRGKSGSSTIEASSFDNHRSQELDSRDNMDTPLVFQGDPFTQPIGLDPPPTIFSARTHPLRPGNGNCGNPIPTNKFYTNILLDSRTGPVFTSPYSLWWTGPQGQPYHGVAVSYTESSQWVYGPNPLAATARYVYSPNGIASIILGATQFDDGNYTFSTSDPTDFAIHASLTEETTGNLGKMTLPLVQGMGMVTALYSDLTPRISSGVGFTQVKELTSPRPDLMKYELTLCNGKKWWLYIRITSTGRTTVTAAGVTVNLEDVYTVTATPTNAGVGFMIQVVPALDDAEIALDQTAGQYVTGAYLTGSISDNGRSGTYMIKYDVLGASNEGEPMVLAAPHHVAGLAEETRVKVTSFKLESVALGSLTGYASTQLEMVETLPNDIGFLPYSEAQSGSRTGCGLTPEVRDLLLHTVRKELDQDMLMQTNLESMYFSGKVMDKFAQIVFVAKYILQDDELARMGLTNLKAAFSVFAENQQQSALVYDLTWRGLVSKAGMGHGDPMVDFGSAYYNDHHFHYGYFIHAAAVIGKLDRDLGSGTWVDDNKEFVNSLVRDVANPSGADKYFPMWRAFDWYAGHSWAKGLFVSYDGKDEESSSEDVHFAYSMKLWGCVTGDGALEARGNLMLAVMRRSLNTYMLYTSDNPVVPRKLLPNKTSGILFENKVDHTTYFGANPEYIQGIHMIPVTSVSSYIRGARFVAEEWDQKLQAVVDSLQDGWRGILMMNRALSNPAESLAFFQAEAFDTRWLDPGMSRSWALAYAASMV